MNSTESDTNPKPDDMPEPAPEKNNQAQEQTPNAEANPKAEDSSKNDQTSNASLKEQLEAAIAERDENRNKWLRTEAELDNYRKRVQREAEEVRKYQALPLVRDLLPGLDNLQRAIQAAETSRSLDDLLTGLNMVAQQFEGILSQHSIQPIEAVGEPFDPNLHEAVQQVPSPDHPPMTVVQDLERGYILHDRVVRPSKVIVSSGPPESTSE